jgi:tetratricopeptide (TPR) repeat protein
MDYDRLRELQAKFDENPRRYFAPLANEYRKGGNPKRAIEICRAHLAQMPGHMSGQVVYGQSLFEGGEYEEARKVFEGALVLDPENLIALRSLGDLSLQAGDSAQARTWYTRLLEADPKDAAVIALIAVIDSSLPGVTETEATSEFTVDFSFVDAPPGNAAAAAGSAQAPSTEPETTAADPAAHAKAPAASEVTEWQPAASEATEAEPASATNAESEAPTASEGADSTHEAAGGESHPPLGLEHHYPTETPARQRPVPMGSDRDALDWSATTDSSANAEPERAGASPDSAEATDASVPSEEQTAPAEQPAAAAAEAPRSTFAGTNPEPFVNETMAQLYLQQGYRQLALRVYRQLAERRPTEQALRDRIAEIEAMQANDPDNKQAQAKRSDPPSIESPTPQPEAPRAPSTETPLPHGPGSQPASVEAPGGDSFPIDSPPTSPSSEPDSIESPARQEPRAEPEGIAARQPSMREFFATLGRRRPPPGRNTAPDSWGRRDAPAAPVAQDNARATSLDAVFAGAKVSSTDARAASTLAGAFSATARATNPPSPAANPTPRANPRLQTQESEEDVAKFRAWLDGLTGE